jgi:hypothetical protein
MSHPDHFIGAAQFARLLEIAGSVIGLGRTTAQEHTMNRRCAKKRPACTAETSISTSQAGR